MKVLAYLRNGNSLVEMSDKAVFVWRLLRNSIGLADLDGPLPEGPGSCEVDEKRVVTFLTLLDNGLRSNAQMRIIPSPLRVEYRTETVKDDKVVAKHWQTVYLDPKNEPFPFLEKVSNIGLEVP